METVITEKQGSAKQRNIFFNLTERRMRGGWRLAIQAMMYFAGVTLFQIIIGIVAGIYLMSTGANVQDPAVVNGLLNNPPVRLSMQVGSLVIILASCFIAARKLDKRPFRAYGFHFNRQWWADMAFGLFLGAFLMLFIYLVERAAGWVAVSAAPLDGSLWTGILMYLAIYLCVGIAEELLSRGYQTRNLAEALHIGRISSKAALLLAYLGTSLFFGLLHASNPNATLTSTLCLVVAGLFLGLGYILTGELALPIGLHITWNFFQGNVFGFPVSGMASVASFMQIEQGGPEVWTGGAFGPESGLVGLAAIALGAVLILGWVRLTRGRVALKESLAKYEAESAA